MKSVRTGVCLVLLVLLAALPVLGSGQKEGTAARQYVLKFNHVLTPQDPYHAAFQKWAEAVSSRTGGNLKIEVFPSAQLGFEEDILEQIARAPTWGRTPTPRGWATTCPASRS